MERQWMQNERTAEKIAEAKGRREAFEEAAAWCQSNAEAQERRFHTIDYRDMEGQNLCQESAEAFEKARDHFRKLAEGEK